MKKIFSLVVVALSLSLVSVSCSNDDDPDVYNVTNEYNLVPEVYEYKNVSFNYDNAGDFYFFNGPFKLYNGEHTLVYMQSDLDVNFNKSWVLLPGTVYYYDAMWYNFNTEFEFTNTEFEIRLYPSNPLPSVTKITFRVVVIPGKMMAKAIPIDYSDYNAVIKHFNIDDSKVKEYKK